MLKEIGFDVMTARDGQEGVDLFDKNNGKITAILLDLTMPVLNGIQAFEKIVEKDSKAKIILCSGYTEEETRKLFSKKSPANFVQKPFTINQLSRKLKKILST